MLDRFLITLPGVIGAAADRTAIFGLADLEKRCVAVGLDKIPQGRSKTGGLLSRFGLTPSKSVALKVASARCPVMAWVEITLAQGCCRSGFAT